MSQPPAPSLDESRWVKTAGSLVGVIGAAVGLVYATGGFVLGLRLYIHHYSFGPVVGQLPRQFLLSFGLSQVVLPSAVVAGLYAAVHLLRRQIGGGFTTRWADATRAKKRQFFAIALLLAALLVLPALVATAFSFDFKRLYVLCGGFVLGLVLSLMLLELRGWIYGDGHPAWSDLRRIALMVLLVGLWSMPFFTFLWANINLPTALLCPTSGQPYRGVLIGETSQRTYIGAFPPHAAKGEERPHHQVISVSVSDVRTVYLAKDAATLSCP